MDRYKNCYAKQALSWKLRKQFIVGGYVSAIDKVTGVPHFLKRTSTGRQATDLVLSHILEGLVDGTLVPGQRINAKHLTEHLGVSVVPVREALHYLAGEGLVELLPLKGARIPTMNPGEIVRWWDIYCWLGRRAIIEVPKFLAADLTLISQIDEAVAGIDSSVYQANPRRFIMTLLNFHKVLNSITGLVEIDEATRRLQVVYWCTYLPNYVDFEVYAQEFANHYHQIGDLIKIGAGEAAFALFEFHVSWSSAIINGESPEPGHVWTS
ncbi:MAG: GntR family transcriptional regulator [Gammaproteobacteria bacterium]|nr:GntR family transcriptional regulator [Gammaproteobacteria bacterium]